MQDCQPCLELVLNCHSVTTVDQFCPILWIHKLLLTISKVKYLLTKCPSQVKLSRLSATNANQGLINSLSV